MGKLGKYELGRTLGEGNFAKVKLAKHVDTGLLFAIKILEKKRVFDLKVSDQVKREIIALKMLQHPNVVRLHEVLASKTKIHMVLELVNGDDLFDLLAGKGKFQESEARKLFHQLIDAVSYCHSKGVFHRDLKLENLLLNKKGHLTITDFGLSAMTEHLRDDSLLHTTCGSPNYVAPEIFSNRGYHGAASDIWSCGVILFATLTGYLPFDDRNLAVLYQKILKADFKIPKWISAGARNLLVQILDPNPETRMTMAEIKDEDWFKNDYLPTEGEEDKYTWEDAVGAPGDGEEKTWKFSTQLNAFQLIGMSSCLDLSGFFENEQVSERNLRFTSHHSRKYLVEKIEDVCKQMGFRIQTKNGKIKLVNKMSNFAVSAEVFEISQSLHVVELRKACGDSSLYRELFGRLINESSGTEKI